MLAPRLADERTLPALAVVRAAGRQVIAARLPGVSASLFDEIERHPLYESTLSEIRSQLTSPLAGYGLRREGPRTGSKNSCPSRPAARATWSNANLLASDNHHVDRPAVASQLDAWWAGTSSPPAALLAEKVAARAGRLSDGRLALRSRIMVHSSSP